MNTETSCRQINPLCPKGFFSLVWCTYISALDKLLGQLGIYATWLSSIAYLQKQLRIFIFFLRHIFFFFFDYTFSYCMKPSGMCLHVYSLPSSAFLKYQTSGFYCTLIKSHPLVDIRACTHCKVSLSSLCFSAKYWIGHQYFFHKLELYCNLASKNKINTRLAFVYIPNGNEMDQMIRNDIACNCIPILRIAFRYAHI